MKKLIILIILVLVAGCSHAVSISPAGRNHFYVVKHFQTGLGMVLHSKIEEYRVDGKGNLVFVRKVFLKK